MGVVKLKKECYLICTSIGSSLKSISIGYPFLSVLPCPTFSKAFEMCCFKRSLFNLFDSGYERNNFIINSIIKDKVHDCFKNFDLKVSRIILIQSHEPIYEMWDSFIGDYFSDTYTLSLSILILNSKCVVVAKEFTNKGVPHFIKWNANKLASIKRGASF